MDVDTIHTLLGGSECVINRKLVKLYGFERAWWLTCLDKRRVMSFRCNEVTDDGYFQVSEEGMVISTDFAGRYTIES